MIALNRVVSVDVIDEGQIGGYSCSFGINTGERSLQSETSHKGHLQCLGPEKFQHRELPARVGGHRSVRAGRGGGLEVKHDQNPI
jgi:hypothetical protein